MSFTLNVYFVDLAAFVPQGGGYRVLFPTTPPFRSHAPYLIYFAGQRDQGSEPGVEIDPLEFLPLDQVDIEFRNVAATSGNLPAYRVRPDDDFPQNARDRDFNWTIDMEELAPGARVNPAALGATPENWVRARAQLDFGRLFVHHFSEEDTADRVHAYRFVDRDGFTLQTVRSKAIPNAVHWQTKIEADSLSIDLRPFRGGPTRSLVLNPPGPQLHLTIGNFGGIREPADMKDFELFYSLLETEPETLWRPCRDDNTGPKLPSQIGGNPFSNIVEDLRLLARRNGDPIIDKEACPSVRIPG